MNVNVFALDPFTTPLSLIVRILFVISVILFISMLNNSFLGKDESGKKLWGFRRYRNININQRRPAFNRRIIHVYGFFRIMGGIVFNFCNYLY